MEFDGRACSRLSSSHGPLRSPVATRDFREGFAEMMPACIGLTPFGLVCGVGAAAAGVDFAGALGMTAIIFSGAAQILVMQLYAVGAPVAVVVLTCFVAGAALPDVQRRDGAAPQAAAGALAERARVPAHGSGVRGVGPSLYGDARPAQRRALFPGRRRAAVVHVAGSTNAIGYLAGNVIPASWSLEFAVPLCFIALVAPVLRDAPAIVAAAAAGGFVLALAALPMKLNLIVAGVIGIVAGTLTDLARERWKARLILWAGHPRRRRSQLPVAPVVHRGLRAALDAGVAGPLAASSCRRRCSRPWSCR